MERGQHIYDRWANRHWLYGLVDRLTRPIRREAVAELGLDGGDTAVDIGCGPGRSLPLLGDAVGGSGRLVGVDYSARMTRLAGGRAVALPAASVIRGDARRLPLADGSADGALASLALSAIPDARDAAAEVRRVLGDSGRFAVVDGQVPDGTLGNLLGAAYRRTVNWQGHDVRAVLDDVFASVETAATYDAGLGVVLVASG